MNYSLTKLETHSQTVHRTLIARELHEGDRAEINKKITESKEVHKDFVEARAIIQKGVVLTQENLKYHISNIVSKALAVVFDDPYEFKVDFVERRNSTECDLLFHRDGKDFDPLESSGYGAADVASFALRVSYWVLGTSAPVILLDEPFRHLSEDKQPAAAEILRQLSAECGLQFLIISHEEEVVPCADIQYHLTYVNKESRVETR